mmetsp:Transcript_25175/g.42132  ORF Transcript_25175/g.42132 Transcript_25175/m.42132 type:complete len:249 (+) Transcript_25175:1718-2464(+)
MIHKHVVVITTLLATAVITLSPRPFGGPRFLPVRTTIGLIILRRNRVREECVARKIPAQVALTGGVVGSGDGGGGLRGLLPLPPLSFQHTLLFLQLVHIYVHLRFLDGLSLQLGRLFRMRIHHPLQQHPLPFSVRSQQRKQLVLRAQHLPRHLVARRQNQQRPDLRCRKPFGMLLHRLASISTRRVQPVRSRTDDPASRARREVRQLAAFVEGGVVCSPQALRDGMLCAATSFLCYEACRASIRGAHR